VVLRFDISAPYQKEESRFAKVRAWVISDRFAMPLPACLLIDA
jgi:hypothetical protein